MIENDEKKMQELAQQQQQQTLQVQQQAAEMQQQVELQKLQQEDTLNQRDNETKILVAQINAQSKLQDSEVDINDGIQEPMSEEAASKLREQIHEFNVKTALERDKLEFEKQKHSDEISLKDRISRRQAATKSINKK